MATEEQKFTGNADALVKEYEKLEARAIKLEEALNKANKTANVGSREFEKSLKELSKQAEQTAKSVVTPLERYHAELDKLKKQLDSGFISQETFNRAVRNAKNELESASNAQGGVFAGSIKNVATMAAGWLTVSAAIGAATKALQEQRRLERETADKQKTLARAQEQVVLNTYGLSASDKAKFLSDIEGVQKKTGFGDLAQLYNAAAGGIGAGGTREQVLDAITAGAELTRNSPEDLQTFAAGAFDVSKASGVQDARKNIAFLLSVGSKSRIVDPKLQAQNVAPAVGGIVGTVQDTDRERATIEAGALFAALGNKAIDTTGESSRTASTGFAVKLRDFFERGITEGAGKNQKLYKPNADPGTLSGRIEFLQQNAELREKFLQNTPFEQRYQVPVEDLLRGGETARDFASIKGAIGFDSKSFDDTARDLRTLTGPLRLAAGGAAADANLENRAVNNSAAARRAEARRIVEETTNSAFPSGLRGFILRAGEQGYFGSGVGGFEQDELRRPGAAPEEIGIGRLSYLRKQLANSEARRPLTDDEQKAVKLLEEQIAVLKQMLVANQAAAAAAGNNRPAALADRGRHAEK